MISIRAICASCADASFAELDSVRSKKVIDSLTWEAGQV